MGRVNEIQIEVFLCCFFLLFVLFSFGDRISLWITSASRVLGLKVCATTPNFFHLFYYTCLLHRPKKSSQTELYWPQNFVVIQTKSEYKGSSLLVLIRLSWTVYIKLVLAPGNTQTTIILSSLDLGRPQIFTLSIVFDV